MPFDLELPLNANWKSYNFQDVYIITDVSFDQSLHEWNT